MVNNLAAFGYHGWPHFFFRYLILQIHEHKISILLVKVSFHLAENSTVTYLKQKKGWKAGNWCSRNLWLLLQFSCRCSTGLPRLTLPQDKEELWFWSSPLTRLPSFTWSFFQQAHNFPQGWSIAPDPDSRLTQSYLVPLALLTWGMLLPPVCASWGNGVSTVWVVACRSCAGAPYSLYRLCFCWMWPPLSDCS